MRRHGQYYVYIVQSRDGTYYTGYTKHLGNRLKLHNAGNGAKYCRWKRPVELVYAKEYRYYKHALRAERRVKQLTRRQKEALVGLYARSHGQKWQTTMGPSEIVPTKAR